MSGTRSHIVNPGLVHTDHAAPGHTEHAHIQRTDIGSVSADDGVIDGGTPVLNDTDIGRRTAHFKIHSVGGAQVHKRSHDAGGRSRQHGQNRALLHLIDFHNAAVSAHDHQRNLHAGLTDAALGAVGSV